MDANQEDQGAGYVNGTGPKPPPVEVMPPEPTPGTAEHDKTTWQVLSKVHADVQQLKRMAWWIGVVLSPVVTTGLGAAVKYFLAHFNP